MPATKISCNSFYMFMLELKKNEEQRGRRCSLQSIEPEASRRWEIMPPELKDAYKLRAREYRTSQEFQNKKREAKNRPHRTRPKTKVNRRCSEVVETSSSDSDTEADVFFDPDEEEKFVRRREDARTKFKTALTWNLGADITNKIMDYSFFIASVQCYYESPSHEYMPAEIAVVEFSLKRGILTQFDTILKPIRIPEHCQTSVIAKASQTHQISITQPSEEYRDDYRNIINEIKSFSICKQQNQFRAFALSRQYNAVQGAAKILRNKTGSKSFLPADKVLCVEDLYILLCHLKGVNPKRSDLSSFNQILTETDFDFEPHTLCIYHNWRQSKFCALGVARKACYYLFDLLQNIYNFSLTPNHIPPLSNNMRYNRPNLSLQPNHFDDDSVVEQIIVPNQDVRVAEEQQLTLVPQPPLPIGPAAGSIHPPNYVSTDIFAECACYERNRSANEATRVSLAKSSVAQKYLRFYSSP